MFESITSLTALEFVRELPHTNPELWQKVCADYGLEDTAGNFDDLTSNGGLIANLSDEHLVETAQYYSSDSMPFSDVYAFHVRSLTRTEILIDNLQKLSIRVYG